MNPRRHSLGNKVTHCLKHAVVAATAALCLTPCAHATSHSLGPVSVGPGVNFQVNQSGSTSFVYVNGLSAADQGCASAILVLVDTNPSYKQIYATLLAAKLVGKQVTFNYSSCWALSSTPLIDAIYIHD